MLGEARKKLGLQYLNPAIRKRDGPYWFSAADLLPNDDEAQLAPGACSSKAGRSKTRVRAPTRWLARDAGNVEAHVMKANASAGLRNWTRRLRNSKKRSRSIHSRTATYATLGAVEAARGRHEQAEAAF